MVGRTPRKPSHKATKANSNTTVLGVRWCGWRPYNSRKERKKLLAGRPRPRRQRERKTTRSHSCGVGEISPPRREADPHEVLAGQPTRLAEEIDVIVMDLRTILGA